MLGARDKVAVPRSLLHLLWRYLLRGVLSGVGARDAVAVRGLSLLGVGELVHQFDLVRGLGVRGRG